jgi:catechol 2,3-dioxygenase-like lactoylglutathione lyase family enzyme
MNILTTPHVSNPLTSLKINHTAIRVPDFDTAVAWYAAKLDFRLKQSVSVAGLYRESPAGWIHLGWPAGKRASHR